MTDTCRVFSYSPNNPKANEYYHACKKFDNIRDKVISYEQRTSDRESPEYMSMMKEFEYWDSKVPETSNIAGEYEDKLIQKQELAKSQDSEKETNSPRNEHHIDLIA